MEVLTRLAATVAGGFLVVAAGFKVVSGGAFHGWLARFLPSILSSWQVTWFAVTAVAVEMLIGGALLLRPTRFVLILAWCFCLVLTSMQVLGWIRGIGPCACFGAPSDSRGGMVGPVLAPLLLAAVSLLLWIGSSGRGFSLWEDILLAGTGLACSLTLLILVEAPPSLRRLRISTEPQ